jgi:hypothetical protein
MSRSGDRYQQAGLAFESLAWPACRYLKSPVASRFLYYTFYKTPILHLLYSLQLAKCGCASLIISILDVYLHSDQSESCS